MNLMFYIDLETENILSVKCKMVCGHEAENRRVDSGVSFCVK